jgi:hypothetical protein
MNELDPGCLGYGALIAIAVSFLKKVPFIARNPKSVATVLSILAVAIPALVRGGADFKVIAFCVIAQLGSSIGTQEIILKRTLDPALNTMLARPAKRYMAGSITKEHAVAISNQRRENKDG